MNSHPQLLNCNLFSCTTLICTYLERPLPYEFPLLTFVVQPFDLVLTGDFFALQPYSKLLKLINSLLDMLSSQSLLDAFCSSKVTFLLGISPAIYFLSELIVTSSLGMTSVYRRVAAISAFFCLTFPFLF